MKKYIQVTAELAVALLYIEKEMPTRQDLAEQILRCVHSATAMGLIDGKFNVRRLYSKEVLKEVHDLLVSHFVEAWGPDASKLLMKLTLEGAIWREDPPAAPWNLKSPYYSDSLQIELAATIIAAHATLSAEADKDESMTVMSMLGCLYTAFNAAFSEQEFESMRAEVFQALIRKHDCDVASPWIGDFLNDTAFFRID